MIVFNPKKRISIENALEHPYLFSIRENMVDPVYSGPMNFGYESNPDLTKEDLCNLLIQEIKDFDTGLV